MPILREGELNVISYSAEQTQRLGARLGRLLRPGDVLCLSGDMGAGKTVFSAGVGRGWGAVHPLTSPTYNLVHQHQRPTDSALLFHLDCYRLHSEAEVDTIGFDDILEQNGVVVIEWAERISGALPAERLWLELRVIEENRRNLLLEASGQRYEDLIQQFRRSTYGN